MEHFILKSVTASVVVLAISSSAAFASDVTMNLGFGAPEEALHGGLAKTFERLAEAYTNGSVDVKLRCCNQISSEDEAFKAMQLGTVDGFFITANNVSPHWPPMDVTVLPYIFQNKEHLVKVLEGEVGQQMKDKLQADTSMHLLAFGPALYRDFYNSVRPVNTMADMARLKVRVPKNEVMIATFEAFGANPVALEHFVAFAPLFALDALMKRLHEEQREQILRAAADASAEHAKKIATATEDVRMRLSTEGGMARTDPDRTEFIAAAKGVQQKFAEERGPEFVDLVNHIQAAAE